MWFRTLTELLRCQGNFSAPQVPVSPVWLWWPHKLHKIHISVPVSARAEMVGLLITSFKGDLALGNKSKDWPPRPCPEGC